MSYLIHHGVKGMKWGVWNEDTRARYNGGRRHVSSVTRENLMASKTSGLDKWGSSSKHNVLYVTGLSGSGKSIVSEGLRDESTNVIHLDFYLEAGNDRTSYRDPEFTEYLQKHTPGIFEDPKKPYNEMSDAEKKEHWKLLDSFEESIKGFGEQQHAKGKKVICEGVQLTDDTLFPDKSFFKDQPIIILSTDADTSLKRGLERDEIDYDDIETITKRKEWQTMWNTRLDELTQTTDAKIGEIYVNELLNSRKG